jgi:hypothetical protein
VQIRALLDRDMKGIRIAWSHDLGPPVEADVESATGYAVRVPDFAPSLSR